MKQIRQKKCWSIFKSMRTAWKATRKQINGAANARKLYEYLSNHKEGLLPYQERGIKLPEAKPGVVYKNMGVQENQNCTAITLRMKHRRMR